MSDDIKVFFDRFVEDFPSFSGKVIASRYIAPYTVMSSDGDIWQCNEPSDVEEYFQSLLDKHSSEGVLTCKYDDLEYSAIGNRCFLATVSWTMMGAEEKVISNWRESYNLLRTDFGLKIFTSIDH